MAAGYAHHVLYTTVLLLGGGLE